MKLPPERLTRDMLEKLVGYWEKRVARAHEKRMIADREAAEAQVGLAIGLQMLAECPEGQMDMAAVWVVA